MHLILLWQMFLIHSDTAMWTRDVEINADMQLKIFLKIAKALKLYFRFEGKQKMASQRNITDESSVIRIRGDALLDDYDETNQQEDEEEEFNETFETLGEFQEEDDANDQEQESNSRGSTTTGQPASSYSSGGTLTGSKPSASGISCNILSLVL